MRERDILDAKYAVVQSLGSGGSGEVYEAENLLLGKRVAIKHLSAKVVGPEIAPQFTARLREIAQLDHPNIATLFDVGSADGRPYIVGERLRGQPLSQEIEGSATGGMATACDLALQMLSALDYAHERGIVHGGLHPGNVIVVYPRPGVPWVKITDLGLYHALEAHSLPEEARAKHARYLAPEVLKGGPLSEAADVYGAAALLYALLHGEPPSEKNGAFEAGGAALPLDIADAIRGGLRSTPADRPSAAALAQRLSASAQIEIPMSRRLSAPPSIRWVDGPVSQGSLRIYGRARPSSDPLPPSSRRDSVVTESLLRNPVFPHAARSPRPGPLHSIRTKLEKNPNLGAIWLFALASVGAGIAFTLLANWLR